MELNICNKLTLRMTKVWDLAIGSWNSGTVQRHVCFIIIIDVCFSIHQSALFRGDGDSQLPAGPLVARGHRPLSRRVKAIVSCFSKKDDEFRAKSEAICSR